MDKKQVEKLEEAKYLLKALGMEKAQTNARSGWVLLSLAGVNPMMSWADTKQNLLTTHSIMAFIREEYGQDYKPNSRETIRRQTLHQLEQAQLVVRNVDMPDRATNSKDNNYALTDVAIEILKEYPNGDWQIAIATYKEKLGFLKDEYARVLDKHKIPIDLPTGGKLLLSPGAHNQLHADIILEMLPRFAKEGAVIYIGDTASSRSEGGKFMHLDVEAFEALGIPALAHDKLPDVVYHDKTNNWLFLVEAVTSHGPVSEKRYKELEKQLSSSKAGKVYVTAFPDMKTFKKYTADIAWETEVWVAERPDHMVHFNGDRFLGPR